MTDNFELIKPLLTFERQGDFYFLQLLQRKKDGCNVPNGKDNQRRLVRDYHITSVEMLDRLKDEIIAACNETGARAYIRLNKRNYRTISMAFAEETLMKARTNQEFGSTFNEINSVIGRYPEPGKGSKTWIVDIDDNPPESELVLKVKDIIARCEPVDKVGELCKVIATIPTRSGTHLITKPFNVQRFNGLKKNEIDRLDSEIDIKKDNPTVLYCP